ncbi:MULTISPECIES: hypothetical protein [unclassified Streptomyces]|uniref:hypothetical protein n=1 Tax=unclassified Streptomyces TaxID=2593676 RepID=UPI00093D2C54|nr:hypothetical protein [Streptomyces sp. TSRI0281]OKI43410.1 hypothetical protein A6A29_08770 [Streptomyces sp. TSRI0281]
MAHGQDGSGDGVLARREVQEKRERLRVEFGSRLRVLFDLAGLSSREFALRYPAYKDSAIRFTYLPGKSLPPWDFLHDLLTEVTRRTDDPAAPQRRTELFTAYRQVLVDIGADARGSDQNSLLLRLLDGEEALRRLGEELAEVRVRENRLRTDLEEESRRARPSLSTGSQDRKHQLEEASRLLAERRNELVHRRGDLLTELDGCRARLVVLEEADGQGDLVPAGSGTGLHHTSPVPHDPPKHPTADPKKPGIRPGVLLIGGAVAVLLLAGGGAAVGIWATGAHDTTDQAVPSPTSVPSQPSAASTPATPTPIPTPTVSPPLPSPSPSPSPSAVPSDEAPDPPPAAVPVRWHGTLTLDDGSSTGIVTAAWSLDTVPPQRALAGDVGMTCRLSCDGSQFTGNAIVLWDGASPPRREQCVGLLNANPAQRSVNVPAGSTACFGTAAGRVGYFTPSGAAANGQGRLEATVWELP